MSDNLLYTSCPHNEMPDTCVTCLQNCLADAERQLAHWQGAAQRRGRILDQLKDVGINDLPTAQKLSSDLATAGEQLAQMRAALDAAQNIKDRYLRPVRSANLEQTTMTLTPAERDEIRHRFRAEKDKMNEHTIVMADDGLQLLNALDTTEAELDQAHEETRMMHERLQRVVNGHKAALEREAKLRAALEKSECIDPDCPGAAGICNRLAALATVKEAGT